MQLMLCKHLKHFAFIYQGAIYSRQQTKQHHHGIITSEKLAYQHQCGTEDTWPIKHGTVYSLWSVSKFQKGVVNSR